MKVLRTTLFDFATGVGGTLLFREENRHILMNQRAALVDPSAPVDVYAASENLLANAIERAPGSEPTTAGIMGLLDVWVKQCLGGLSSIDSAGVAFLDYRCKSAGSGDRGLSYKI